MLSKARFGNQNAATRTAICCPFKILCPTPTGVGLKYRRGEGGKGEMQCKRATVDRLLLQRCLLEHGTQTFMQVWKNLLKGLRDDWEWEPLGGKKDRVPLVAAIWFGIQIPLQHRSVEWPVVMFALWTATRTSGAGKITAVYNFDPASIETSATTFAVSPTVSTRP